MAENAASASPNNTVWLGSDAAASIAAVATCPPVSRLNSSTPSSATPHAIHVRRASGRPNSMASAHGTINVVSCTKNDTRLAVEY
eukprot:scaffold13_cov377-Prasinococcus_capsulatus_cf.AAC.19